MARIINVYSSDRNGFEGLSNLAPRPFYYLLEGKKLYFKTAEHLYQILKALYAGDRATANEIYGAETGFEACRLGRAVQGLPDSWDDVAEEKLEMAMRESFLQNKKALDLLLSTGDAEFTHVHPEGTFSLGTWEIDFPRLLTKLRGEFQDQLTCDTNASPADPGSLTPKLRGKMTFPYGKFKRTGITAKTTADAIRCGERTATTRYESDGHLDYWLQADRGDLIEFIDAKGRPVLVRVTRPLAKLPMETDAETWCRKEGWSEAYFEAKVLPRLHEAWQIEYELLGAPEHTSEGSAQLSLFDLLSETDATPQ